jgi:glycosyltransferase involved in cell wall biosynthesis/peptidoglycan/xylan/chitin deacetylase (PgdA/CDA1 family)
MPKKTIVLLSLAYSPTIGGAEKQAQFLAETWVSQGWPVLVLTRRLPGAPHEEIIGGVRIVRLPNIWWPGFSWITFCFAALWHLVPMSRKISCIMAIMLNPGTLPGAVLGLFFGVPLIMRPSAGGPGGNIQSLRRSFFGGLKLSFFLTATDYVIAMNQEVVQELKMAGVANRKIRKIANGVDLQHFTPAGRSEVSARRRHLGLQEEGLFVLFVGRLEKVKNLDGLISIWGEIVRMCPSVKLVIVGDGTERLSLGALIREKGLEASIKLEGLHQDMLPYYQAADLFILPSHREGISNALLEAMACGVVPVATRVGGNREILDDFSPDLLIDPENPEKWPTVIVPLLKNQTRRHELSCRARAFIEKGFSATSVERQYRELISNIDRPIFRRSFPILAYHRVLPSVVYGVDTSLQEFEEQMDWLVEKRYQTISLAAFNVLWKEGRTWPDKTIVLTFDDGHREFYDYALPVLKRYGFSATLFVNTGMLGNRYWVEGRKPSPVRWHEVCPVKYRLDSPLWRTYEFMTWDQIRELSHSGFEICSHAVTHPFLTDLSESELLHELRDSKKMLEDQLNISVNYFCYPSGDFDLRVQKAAKEAGYIGAVYSPGHDQISYYWDDPMMWERIGVWRDTPLWKYKALVSGCYVAVRQRVPEWAWNSFRTVFRLARRPFYREGTYSS